MPYSLDPTTDGGKVRLLIFDAVPSGTSAVVGANYFIEDNEIDGILDLNSSDLWYAAADLCRCLAAKYASEAINLGLGKGDIKIDKTKKSDFYIELAKQYTTRSGGDVVEYIDSANYRVTGTGYDASEYVGDNE